MTDKPVYFCLMRGLRGGYMPDDVEHCEASTLDDFKASVRASVEFADMVWDYPDEHADKDTMWAQLWEHAQSGKLEMCVAVARDNDAYGLTLSGSCESDYLEYCEAMENA